MFWLGAGGLGNWLAFDGASSKVAPIADKIVPNQNDLPCVILLSTEARTAGSQCGA